MSGFRILGLGTALPQHWISQENAAVFAGTAVGPKPSGSSNAAAVIRTLYRRSGVESRHSVLLESSDDHEATASRFYHPAADASDRGPDTAARMKRYHQEATPLASAAAAEALREGSVEASEVTHLITVSCSGFSAPGVDLGLIEQLGLSRSIARTHVGFMGCHGVLNGLRAARAFAASDPEAVVLVCAIELCSLHHQYGWNPQNIVANSLFADGAAAIVGRADRGLPDSNGSWPGRLVDNASFVIPDTTALMTWEIGNHGFEMSLSPEVPAIISRTLPAVLKKFLIQHQLSAADIRHWAVHPGGPRILDAVAESVPLSDELLAPSRSVLLRCGNMSSPTVLFILRDLQLHQASGPCVMLGFGPGLNVEMALLRP